MFSKIWFINLVILGVSLLIVVQGLDIWSEKDDPVSFADFSKKGSPKEKRDLDLPGIRVVPRPILPESAYRVIRNKNLFSKERKPYEPEPESEPEAETVETVRISGKSVNLYGVIMSPGYTAALVDNPEQGRDEPKNIWVKTGDSIGNLKVAKIHRQSLEVVDQGKTFEVLLYQKKKAGTSGSGISAAHSAPNVVSAGEKPKISQPPQPEPKAAEEEVEYEIVHTPFGKFKRKKKK